MIEVAFDYLARGFSVLPVLPNKRPAIRSWKEYSTRRPRPDEVMKWWTLDPTAGIGIICGRVSGLIVLDVEAAGVNEFPVYETLTATTQSGGRHHYFRYEHRRHFKHYLKNAWDQHVADVRSDGSYVLAPPTRGIKGVYRWLNDLPVGPVAEGVLVDVPVLQASEPSTIGWPQAVSSSLLVWNGYRSRSERLLAIANRVVAAGGGFDDVKRECLADWAGTKIRERGANGDKYIDHLVHRARTSNPPVVAVPVRAMVVWLSDGFTDLGRRLTFKLKLDTGEVFRDGVTMMDGSQRAVIFREFYGDKLREGANIRIDVGFRTFGSRSVRYVRQFLGWA